MLIPIIPVSDSGNFDRASRAGTETGSVVSTGIKDQHCMLHLASDSDVRVGDILIFGLSLIPA
jgi:hypothetical protein